jgi:asparagine synthase (glutamine-hydrolysing)
MCGINGFVGNFSPELLRQTSDVLSHRGPDDFGNFYNVSSSVGLAHRRLSIVDLSPLGHQPMFSTDSAVVLVYNGEIYNQLELRTELIMRGYVFRGHSDTEVLLNMYLAEGADMLPKLNGIFAFAIWDARKQSMLLARDALGVKPLYYSALNGRFAFASEIKALLHLVPEARELDVTSLHRYLSFLWCPGEGTPLKAVKKLLPGQAMWVHAGQIERRWTWYQLPVFRGVYADLDESSALKGTTRHLRQAVRRQMMADVPVGAFLSGGLDSSAIVAFAREINPDIHCFTIDANGGQEAGATNDLPYALKVAKHLGVPLDVVSIDADRMAGDLERMVAQLDEPLADPAPLNVLYISQLARDQGMKVLLSGAGGDDLFTGYRRHRAVQAERLWRWLPHGLRSGLAQATAGLDQQRAFTRRLSKLFSGAALEGDDRLVEYFRWARESDLLDLYTTETRQALGAELAASPMLDFLYPLPNCISPLDRMLALEQRFFLADHNLTYTDKMSMAVGVEVRVPFLDLELVEFSAHIPMSLKQRGSEGKWILKQAMEPFLPHEVIYRPKSGFGAPLRRWMQHDLRSLLGDLLSVNSLKRRGLFEPTAVQRLIAANDAGKIDASYTLLSLLCIEIWCRTYLDTPV